MSPILSIIAENVQIGLISTKNKSEIPPETIALI